MQILRPYGIVIDGRLELGVELLMDGARIHEIRPHTGIPEPYVVSTAFVNAHSHLEYRGLQGQLQESNYWPWIMEIVQAKREQSSEHVAQDAIRAAEENRRTGVALIAEHSDRPVSGTAMKEASLRGVIFQEVTTTFRPGGTAEVLATARENAKSQAAEAHVAGFPIPHAYQTVDAETLRAFGSNGSPISLHVAETDLENQLTLNATGAIADAYDRLGIPYEPTGLRLIPTLDQLGLLRPKTQFVHCCAIDAGEVPLLAERGVSVAHCPRSNKNLNCPTAPVREMLDAGVLVGLGLDSAASSGPIDMFDEMRSALRVSLERGRPVSPEEVWSMATHMGAQSVAFAVPGLANWQIKSRSSPPLIRINMPDALSTEDLIQRGHPDLIDWI